MSHPTSPEPQDGPALLPINGHEALVADDLSEEDARLLTAWLAGPGARPTPAEGARWLQCTQELRATGIPSRRSTFDHQQEQA